MAENISRILTGILPKEHNWKILLYQNWENIIGNLKDIVKIEKIYPNLIILEVSHPSWAQELFLLSNMLKNKINAILKEDRITEIRFQVSSSKKFKKKRIDLKSDLPYKNTNYDIKLNLKEQQTLERINNWELKELLKEYYFRCKK